MTNLTPEAVEAVRERVTQFKMLELPGQPMMMHMGTSHLVSELDAIARDWLRLKKVEEAARLVVDNPFEHPNNVYRIIRAAMDGE